MILRCPHAAGMLFTRRKKMKMRIFAFLILLLSPLFAAAESGTHLNDVDFRYIKEAVLHMSHEQLSELATLLTYEILTRDGQKPSFEENAVAMKRAIEQFEKRIHILKSALDLYDTMSTEQSSLPDGTLSVDANGSVTDPTATTAPSAEFVDMSGDVQIATNLLQHYLPSPRVHCLKQNGITSLPGTMDAEGVVTELTLSSTVVGICGNAPLKWALDATTSSEFMTVFDTTNPDAKHGSYYHATDTGWTIKVTQKSLVEAHALNIARKTIAHRTKQQAVALLSTASEACELTVTELTEPERGAMQKLADRAGVPLTKLCPTQIKSYALSDTSCAACHVFLYKDKKIGDRRATAETANLIHQVIAKTTKAYI